MAPHDKSATEVADMRAAAADEKAAVAHQEAAAAHKVAAAAHSKAANAFVTPGSEEENEDEDIQANNSPSASADKSRNTDKGGNKRAAAEPLTPPVAKKKSKRKNEQGTKGAPKRRRGSKDVSGSEWESLQRKKQTTDQPTGQSSQFTNNNNDQPASTYAKPPQTKGLRGNIIIDIPPIQHAKGFQILNSPYQGFQKGRIEHKGINKDLPKTSIGWLVHYDQNIEDPGIVFFDAGDERYGGPFNFLSNDDRTTGFKQSPKELLIEGHTWVSGTQFLYYYKAVLLWNANERFTDILDAEYSSTQLFKLIIQEGERLTSSELGFIGRSFDVFQSELWVASWLLVFLAGLRDILQKLVRSKFAVPGYREKLMMTGNFELVFANKWNHHDLGIGYTARQALEKQKFWGPNLLGKALMNERERIRAEDPEKWPKVFAVDYFRWCEKTLEKERFGLLETFKLERLKQRRKWLKGDSSSETRAEMALTPGQPPRTAPKPRFGLKGPGPPVASEKTASPVPVATPITTAGEVSSLNTGLAELGLTTAP